MPLTPADVHNVAFSKPPIGKRGYNEDEVDAFLDLVEAELARLIEENDDLREQVAERDGLIGLFRTSLHEQEAALLAAREAELALAADPLDDGAEVHSLPRRSRPADQPGRAFEHELAMVLPNYEATRRAV